MAKGLKRLENIILVVQLHLQPKRLIPRMPNFVKIAVTLFIVFIGYGSSFATHIVGGDFYYKKISNNLYSVTLKLYIDCENGNPAAIQSDAIAIISIWDAKTNRLQSLENFSRTGPKRLNKLHYKCLIPPQDVCVDEYVYTRIMSINPGRNGVILSFQRCCRNNSITNIVTPESTGATYWVKIPGTDIISSNSSAVFKELPPNYLCTDAPLKFDHSAVDPDGDSLVYELYQPYLGASRNSPRPDNGMNGPLKAPPFNTLFWKSPYQTNDQMGGDPIMEINRWTGELTVTPKTEGQFVIGIKVKEYRNGVLIGETLRDYQMNVKKCKFDLVAAFAAPTYACSDTVFFANKSYKATNYYWDFGDLSTEADTSSEPNPSYIYPGNGDYEVTLYAWNTICNDEYTFIVRVRTKIEFELGPPLFFCDKVDAYLTARVWDASQITWNNGKIGNTIHVYDTGSYIASVFYGECVGKDTIELLMDPVEFTLPTDSLFCELQDVDMVADVGVPDLKYRWSTSPYDTFQTLRIQDTGIYWVRVRNEHCQKVDTLQIYLSTKPEIGSYLFVCNEFEKVLDAGDIRDAQYLWSDGSTGRFNNINKAGVHWIQVTQKQCVSRDTLLVENPIINLDLGNDSNYCDLLYRYMEAPDGMESYLWHDGSTTRSFSTQNPGKYYVMVTDTNGCIKSDTLNLSLTNSPQIELGSDTSICLRSVVKLGTPEEFYWYSWSNGSNDQFINVSDSGQYVLTVTDESGCKAKDTVRVHIDINALPNDLLIPNSFSPNNDNLNETFPFSILIAQPEYHARVYNRWGQKVFDSVLDGSQWWDGTFSEEASASEAFVYLIEFRACNGENKRVSGTVTLLE
jgi:gliding motility-associated-like protein